jgi:hypothetical protein
MERDETPRLWHLCVMRVNEIRSAWRCHIVADRWRIKLRHIVIRAETPKRSFELDRTGCEGAGIRNAYGQFRIGHREQRRIVQIEVVLGVRDIRLTIFVIEESVLRRCLNGICVHHFISLGLKDYLLAFVGRGAAARITWRNDTSVHHVQKYFRGFIKIIERELHT